MLGVRWTGERWLTRRCRSGEVVTALAARGAEDFGDIWLGIAPIIRQGVGVQRRLAGLVLRIYICPGLDEGGEYLGVLVEGGGDVERYSVRGSSLVSLPNSAVLRRALGFDCWKLYRDLGSRRLQIRRQDLDSTERKGETGRSSRAAASQKQCLVRWPEGEVER